MRRLIVELSVEDVGKYLNVLPAFQKLELFEVLSFLKETPEEVALICRVRFKEPKTKLKAVFEKSALLRHLDTEKDDTHIYYVKRQPSKGDSTSGFLTSGGYLAPPFEVRNGILRATFLGTATEIKRFLQKLRATGFKHRIVSLMDAKFSVESPLGKLTEKQRKVITAAYNLGYYDFPKRISSDELAKKLGIRSSTLVNHRIKAERRLLAELLSN